MLLRAIRAHGWRSLLDLPKMVVLAICAAWACFAALMAALEDGALRGPAPLGAASATLDLRMNPPACRK